MQQRRTAERVAAEPMYHTDDVGLRRALSSFFPEAWKCRGGSMTSLHTAWVVSHAPHPREIEHKKE